MTRLFFDSANWIREQMPRALSWKDVEEIRSWWTGPFFVKGILDLEDTARSTAVSALDLLAKAALILWIFMQMRDEAALVRRRGRRGRPAAGAGGLLAADCGLRSPLPYVRIDAGIAAPDRLGEFRRCISAFALSSLPTRHDNDASSPR